MTDVSFQMLDGTTVVTVTVPDHTCGTCKYFGRPHEDDIYVPTGYHVCNVIERMDPHDKLKPAPVAGVIDASGYYATLCVKEEFGCNLWEGKPQQPVP